MPWMFRKRSGILSHLPSIRTDNHQYFTCMKMPSLPICVSAFQPFFASMQLSFHFPMVKSNSLFRNAANQFPHHIIYACFHLLDLNENVFSSAKNSTSTIILQFLAHCLAFWWSDFQFSFFCMIFAFISALVLFSHVSHICLRRHTSYVIISTIV